MTPTTTKAQGSRAAVDPHPSNVYTRDDDTFKIRIEMPFARCLTRAGSHMARATTRLPLLSIQRAIGIRPQSTVHPYRLPKSKLSQCLLGNRSRLQPCFRITDFRYRAVSKIRAQTGDPIAAGDKLPEAKFNYFDTDGNMKEITVNELCNGKKVILFAVPGAFTPTCSLKHLPGFIKKADEFKAAGVDTIACIGVNDAFVMDAWGKSVGINDNIMMLADGSALFTKAIGVDLDLTDKGLGIRSRRYAMLVDDGVVSVLKLEEGGAFTLSSAEDILAAL